MRPTHEIEAQLVGPFLSLPIVYPPLLPNIIHDEFFSYLTTVNIAIGIDEIAPDRALESEYTLSLLIVNQLFDTIGDNYNDLQVCRTNAV